MVDLRCSPYASIVYGRRVVDSDDPRIHGNKSEAYRLFVQVVRFLNKSSRAKLRPLKFKRVVESGES